jgi:hypothetical protein
MIVADAHVFQNRFMQSSRRRRIRRAGLSPFAGMAPVKAY